MRKDLCLICYMIFSFMCCFPTAKAHKINQKNNVIEEQADIELSLDPIPDLTIETIRSELYSIDSLCRKGLIVLVFTSTKCPVTNQYKD